MSQSTRISWILGSLVVLGLGAAVLAPANLSDPDYIDPAPLSAFLQRSPHFTWDQNRALLRQIRMQQHPSWRTLPPLVRLQRTARIALKTLSNSASSTPPNANFIGNTTLVVNTSGPILGLQRETDCSLTLFDGSFTFATSSAYPTFQIDSSTTHYEQVLHSEAGLTTTPDSVTTCTDANLGLGSRRGGYLGKTGNGDNVFAWTAFNSFHNGNALYSTMINTASTQVQTSNADFSALSMFQLTFGDLNGDGIADVIGLDADDTTLHVWLAAANGTLGAATTYSLPGSTTEAAVVADVNGDGNADVVVATRDTTTNQETLSVLTGTGTGTLNAARSFTVTTPNSPQGGGSYLVNLLAADFRGHGVDLIGSNGIVLLNNGSGTFTVGTAAFPAISATSNFGPNMAAGDFNKDGKLDLAVNDGVATYIYLGNGNGTFTAGPTYASDGSVGYLAVSDLDGDGNPDLWIGSADGGVFLGDQFGLNEGYALMGNGDGTFQGAPVLPFMYTGFNVAALTGNTFLGAVGVNANGTLTTYLGDGKGNFNAKTTFPISTTYQGQTIGPGGDGSFALGDVNGDGIPDLVYNSGYTSGGNPAPGLLIALGNGQGGFGTPTFYPVPSTLAAGDIDIYWTISDVRVADLNRDGNADLVYSYTDTSSQMNTTYSGTVVQLSNGDGTFRAPSVIPYQSAAYSSSGSTQSTAVQVITDLNKDGIPDILSLGGTTTRNIYTSSVLIQVALGKGDGTFGTPMTAATIQIEPLTDFGPTLVTGDMNGDGIPDILALTADASENAQLEVWLGNGDGTYKAPIITSYAAQYLNTGQTLAVADFNGDGKLDVAIFDPYTPTDSGISFGNGDGTFQTITAANTSQPGALPAQTFVVSAFGTALASDFNGDGKPDVLVGATLLLSQAASTSSSPARTATVLAVAPSTATVGQSVTLTAKVTSAVTGTPSGTVRFLDGATVLGSQALAATGTATLVVTTLGPGAHSLTAQYSGDTTFASSTSSEVSLTVNAATPAFTVAASPASGSVALNSSVTTTLTLTPSGGFSGTVALTCTGLPTGATCAFSPSSVTLGASAATSTLTIATAAQTAALNGIPWAPGGIVLGVFLIPLFRSRRANAPIRGLAWTAVLSIGTCGLHGCGGSSSGGGTGGGSGGTPAGTYTIVITATAGTTTQTVNYTLTVT